MEYSFKYETEKYDELEVIFDVYAEHEDDATVEDISLWTKADVEVDFGSLTETEQSKIEELSQAIADDKAHEVWFESQIAKADAMMDSWKDRDL